MRIALLTTQWPGVRTGGIGTYTAETARALAAAGADVHVFTLTLPAGAVVDLGPRVQVHQVREMAERLLAGEDLGDAVSSGVAAQRLLQSECFAQAVHAAGPFDVIEAPEYEALGLGCMYTYQNAATRPVIVTHVHSGSAINRIANERTVTAEDEACEMLESLALQQADACCAPSEAVVRTTRQFVPELDATVIGLGADASVAPSSDDDGSIVFVGRLERLKGFEVLVDALRAFLPQHAGARIVLIGADTRRGDGTSMRAWAQSMLPSGNVTFTGELPPAQVDDHLRRCRLVVVPSLHESFNLVAARAMTFAKPVVCSTEIGTAELVGPHGVTFPSGDSTALAHVLGTLWPDPARCRAIGDQLRRRAVEHFAHERIAARRLAFYQQVKQKRLQLPPLADVRARVQLSDVLTPGRRLLKAIADRPPTRILLFGAGRHTARLLAEKKLWQTHGHEVVGIIDEHPRFADGGTFLNLPVHSITAAIKNGHRPIVVLSSDTMEDLFWQRAEPLRHAGFTVLRLYA